MALSTNDLLQIEADVAWLAEYKRTHQREYDLNGRDMGWASWYPWQQKYFESSKEHTETLLMAGNQVGKSQPAGFEDALDLTGQYPEWWQGFRFDIPINLWLFGVSGEQLRDVLQKQLLGKLRADGSFTGGWIHPDEIVPGSIVRSSGVRNLATEVGIKHRNGGESHISLKSYTQIETGQDTLPHAGSVVDKIRCDEQPPDKLRGQLAVRILNGNRGKGGKLKYTLTPELGETELVRSFYSDQIQPSQMMIGPISWNEAPHLTPEKQAAILAAIPKHEHEMRRMGIPFMGSGRIYTQDEDSLLVDPFEVSARPWLRCLKSVDLGIGENTHASATAWWAFDPESDITYLCRAEKAYGREIALHAAMINSMWPNVSTVFPPDVGGREKSGRVVRELYEEAGIHNGVDFHNCDKDKTKYVEPGIMAIQKAEAEGKLKIFRGCCEPYVLERRTYHRKDGKIVKANDDCMDGGRYGFQMVRDYGETLMRFRTNQQATGTWAEKMGRA